MEISRNGKLVIGVLLLVLVGTLACAAMGLFTPLAESILQSGLDIEATVVSRPTSVSSISTSTSPPRDTPTATLASPEPTADISDCTLGAAFQADVTVPDNTRIGTGQPFVKTWRIRNTGTCEWGRGYRLTFIDGNQMSGPASVTVPKTPAGESAEVSAELVASMEEGQHRGTWQICVNETECFGEQVYVQIVTFALPTPEGTPTPAATNTPTPPLYVEVFNVTPHTDYDGDLWLYGEVRNTGSLPAKRIEVTATLYDENGAVLAVDSSSARTPLYLSIWYVGVLHPSEQAPFRIHFESPGEWENWQIRLTYSEATESDFAKHYNQLRIVNDQGRPVDELLYNYRVSGEIENTGESETGRVRIITTLYDAQGRVVGIDDISGSELDPLLPGEAAPFSVDLYARGPVASYRLFIRSVKH